MLKHIVAINAIGVVGNVLMLLIGGYLVVKEQLTIGQLVASELVVSAILYGFMRLGGYLQRLYGLLAASEKLHSLLTLRQETCWESLSFNAGPPLPHCVLYPESICVSDLPYFSGKNGHTNTVSFDVLPNQSLVLYHHEGIQKSKLVEQLLRLRGLTGGQVTVNGVHLQDTALSVLRDRTAFLRKPLLITGTVLDNLTMGCHELSIEKLSSSLRQFGLADVIEALEHGLDTPVSGLSHPFTIPELCMINWLHAWLQAPKFWVLDGFLDLLRNKERAMVIDALHETNALVLVTTASQRLSEMFDKKVVL
jgi:putative ABC transport system ATP-binding protein